MKLKNVITILLVSIGFSTIHAQKVKLKKDKILIDQKEVFNYEKNGWIGEFSIYELNTTNEIIFIRFFDNETQNYPDDDYIKVRFITLGMEMEHSIAYFGKGAVKWLLKNGVFDTNGKLNEDKIKKFISKYDENITNRTMRN